MLRKWRLLTVLCVAIIADSVATNIMTPFAPDFIIEGLDMPREWAGLYSGLLIGVFSFAVAFSSPVLGHLSDKHGRRAILLFGTLSAAVLTFALFATYSFALAMVFRTAAGLTDATQSVAYASIGDIATGPDRTVAFAYSSAAFQVARILSSTIGGYTVNVEMRWFGRDNPYLLPAIIGSALCLVSAVVVYFYMEETLPGKAAPELDSPGADQALLAESSQDPLHADTEPQAALPREGDAGSAGEGSTTTVTHGSAHSPRDLQPTRDDSVSTEGRPEWPSDSTRSGAHTDTSSPDSPFAEATHSGSFRAPRRPTASGPLFSRSLDTLPDPGPRSLAGRHSAEPQSPSDRPPAHPADSSPAASPATPSSSFSAGWRYTWTDKVLLRVMLVYALINFLNGAVLVLIPLIGLEPETHKGFGFSTAEVGNILLVFAAWATVFQLLLFKPLVARTSLKTANALGCCLMAVSCSLLPCAGYLRARSRGAFWTVVIGSMWVMGSGFMLCSSLLNTMIANRAPRDRQGSIQGVSRALASLCRAAGPFLCGALFSAVSRDSFSAPILAFACLSLGYGLCGLAMSPVPADALEKANKSSDTLGAIRIDHAASDEPGQIADRTEGSLKQQSVR